MTDCNCVLCNIKHEIALSVLQIVSSTVTTTKIVHQAIGTYLKLAPYRQGRAGKGAARTDLSQSSLLQSDTDVE